MVNHKIAKLSGIIKRQIYQIISEEGLNITPEQWVILVYLWENDGQTIGDLVTQSQKDFANVTRIVEKLSKNGYIIKRKNHKDGRSVLLYCTDKVKTIMPHINKCQMLSLNISLKGISQESSLKMLELTAGKTVAVFDTPLGFRHGPKSIINDSTLTVVYVSNDEYTYKYDLDLIKEISSQRKNNKLVVVSDKHSEEIATLADYTLSYDINENVNNAELGLAYITFAQTLAVLKSLSLNLTPDNPCPSGEVNRVVKGVTLYPYTCK